MEFSTALTKARIGPNENATFYKVIGSYTGAIWFRGRWVGFRDLRNVPSVHKFMSTRRSGAPSSAIKTALKGVGGD